MGEPRTSNRVLLVEDDPGIRDALQMLLELEGYRVDTAENGQEGLELLRAGVSPCLIVLDLAMPVMDGAEFRRQQLADPHLAHTPVVVCSAIPPGGLRAEQLGAIAYLKKPIDIDALLSTIRTVAEPRTAAEDSDLL